jgi:SET domain-containing protein
MGDSLSAPSWKSEYVEARPSQVHGLGVFAIKPIKKGTYIQAYQGITRTFAEFKALHGNNYRYSYSMCRIQRIIDGKSDEFKTANISHYCNESDTPNVILQKKGLIANQDIECGQELFLSYPKYYPRTYRLE